MHYRTPQAKTCVLFRIAVHLNTSRIRQTELSHPQAASTYDDMLVLWRPAFNRPGMVAPPGQPLSSAVRYQSLSLLQIPLSCSENERHMYFHQHHYLRFLEIIAAPEVVLWNETRRNTSILDLSSLYTDCTKTQTGIVRRSLSATGRV